MTVPGKSFFFPIGKLGGGSLGAHFNGLVAEDDVSLLAAALRIQVGLISQLRVWMNSCSHFASVFC